ncbi:MAG TPA: tetratricopeptide repeat protein [Thermoanaerobaculia bacterium]|nr:tetratricopeptide repeat protein [Thermoanaerobaculia bacterium]
MPDSSSATPRQWPEPPSGIAANIAGIKERISATPAALQKELDSRPLLWVGAGTSVAAGYPGTGKILKALAARADDPIDENAPFPQIVDAFVASRGAGELGDILQKLFEPRSREDHQPTPVHRAIARLAGAGRFHAIATTNYDDLLERALSDTGVPYVLQPLEGNAAVAGDGAVRLLKLHGSREDWMEVVLSGRSYEEFGRNYPFLSSQLDVLLRQRAVLFVGCSLQDPRLLDWLAAQTEEAARGLKPWRPLMTADEWKAATEATWEGGHASGALARGNVRPLILRDHAHLSELWGRVASEVAPEVRWLEIEIEVSDPGQPWEAHMAGCPDWQPPDPLANPALRADLDRLRELGYQPLPTNERGQLSPKAAVAAATLRSLAAEVGDRLTEALLSPDARKILNAAIHAGFAGETPLLHLRIRPEGGGEEAERRADRALALPWELLRLDGRFPVEEGTLDLAREAVVPGVPGLGPPDRPLAVVATVAAPVDATALDYEDEMYRLWQALGRESDERRLLVTDLGTLDELAREVERFHPPVIHFSGHGRAGRLYFEDEAALTDEVPVSELVRRLREAGPLPRLVYLSACHGATAGASGRSNPGERMVDAALAREETQPSTAASLHRAGFPQVVAYFGPVGDRQATRAAAVFYAALGSGKKAWEALRRARRVSTDPHEERGRSTHVYPLGWAQLALYHRGGDVPTALTSGRGEPAVDLEEKRRTFERLDREGGSERVEGIRGVQRLRFGFVGRRKERAGAIRRWRRGERRLVVLGLGGLGKTALCAELAPLLARDLKPGGARVLALDGRHAGAQPNPLLALWQEVQSARSGEEWSQILAGLQENGLTGEALGKAVTELAKLEGGLLVYLDDAESLQVPVGEGELGCFRDPELQRFWEVLLAAASTASPIGLLVSSRYLPEGTPRSAEFHLPQLRPYEVVRLLSWMPTLGRLPAEDRAWLAEKIDGHPRTVEYLEVLARAQEEKRVSPGGCYDGRRWREEILEPVLPKTQEKVGADLLLGKVWAALPTEAQEHLGRCSVITAPVPWDAVLALQPEEGTAARLVENGMLSPFQSPVGSDDWWAPHRLVAEEAQRHWTGMPQEAHRQLGEWFDERFTAEGLQFWAERAVQHLTQAGEGDKAWPSAERLIISLRSSGRYREALSWVEQVLAAAPTKAQLGKGLAFQVDMGRLANIIPNQAEENLLQALELVEPEDRGFVLNNLGKLARRNGDISKAAVYFDISIRVETAQKGEIHFDVAVSLHELASVLRAEGDLDGARQKLEHSLQILVQVFGTEINRDVAGSFHSLAGVLQLQGDLDGARRNLERSLQILAQVFGTEIHPDVAASLHELAGVLKAQGDLDGAQLNLERCLQISAQVFGTEIHPDVAASLHVLAGILQAQGDLDGARQKLERSLQILVQVFGTEIHPSVAASLHEYAGVLEAQGDLDGARQNFERVLEIRGSVHGTREHYLTAITETNLGLLLRKQGKKDAGGKLLAHAYSVFLSKLGPDNPYTRNLAALVKEESP